MRVTIPPGTLDSYQIEKGTQLTAYESYTGLAIQEDQLSVIIRQKLNETTSDNQFKHVRDGIKELFNPFVKTQIKLIGDSITHGVGGTGFAQDGETIYSNWKVNTSGYCWANLLKGYIEGKFNRDISVPVEHEGITLTLRNISISTTAEVGSFATLAAGQKATFSFYGDHFGVYFSKSALNGVFDIIVDGTTVGSLWLFQGSLQSLKKCIL